MDGYFSFVSFVENFGSGSKGTSPLMWENRVELILQGILPALIASSFFYSTSFV
jgi:hypothetical protein